jgi:hypothetical protein
MIEIVPDVPAGVIGFEAVGEIEARDYTETLIPALEAAGDTDDIRCVFILGDRFEGYSAGAAWQDAKLGIHHHGKWRRAALVSDLDWVRHVASLFGWMVPGAFAQYPLAERDAAIAWVAED